MGVDCTGSSEPEVIVNEYRNFLKQVMQVSPNSLIVVNNLLPVDASMDNENKEEFLPSNEKINRVNYHLVQMCDELGVKYLNSAPV